MKFTKLNFIPTALPLSLLSLLALASSAHAQMTATFKTASPVYASSLPQTIAVTGTLVNNFAAPIYLNSDFSTVDAPLTISDDPFQNTFVFAVSPAVLIANGGQFQGTIFDFLIPGGTAAGNYNAQFVIYGGTDQSAFFALAETPATFEITILPAAVPEASTTTSLGLLLVLGGAVIVMRRKKAAAA